MTYYGKETESAMNNFSLNHKKTNINLIYAIAVVKKAAALTYEELNIKPEMYNCIAEICDRIINGEFDDSFIIEALQGGAGTSTNMNLNEVIATAASEKTGRLVHPLNDVNRGQSTNDVYPTALRIAAVRLLRNLSDACAKLQESLQTREKEFDEIKKLGRTELMDAVPITLGSEFGAYAQAIARDRWRLYKVEERLRQVNIGGTAVGRYDNAERKYRFRIIEILRELTGIGLASAEYPMDVTQNNDVFVETSGLLKALAVNLMKIANDIRLMASGPRGGIGELTLPEMQKGSSIMPGKVNPVIPEMVMQCAMRVIANDNAITMAAAHGEFELNAFFPLIADSMLESLNLLERAVCIFDEKCISVLIPNKINCEKLLKRSFAYATSYSTVLGYDTVAEIVKASKTPSEAEEKLKILLKNNNRDSACE
ncbi:MAG: lyase family protein [Spirochaetales bacterium]|nr:lyase family protein [Spirochaetales bacterium]